ncbi:hypothetical protein AAFF_G00093770 [Aldrovandia affinis]|uniref:Uncharacterized protein n=1 Tax=Aldrovandia affinis TaxID=143900 RepID=A0AAD7WXL8_9TELE|nr:hypothetical protein AAFF_G00093770 [Aldrovandia affinis]
MPNLITVEDILLQIWSAEARGSTERGKHRAPESHKPRGLIDERTARDRHLGEASYDDKGPNLSAAVGFHSEAHNNPAPDISIVTALGLQLVASAARALAALQVSDH